MTQAQKWANEAMHLKNENVDLRLLNEKLLSALYLVSDTLRELCEHQAFEDDAPEFNEGGIGFEACLVIHAAIKAAKDA